MMNQNNMMTTANDLIYLVSCAVNNELPDPEVCEKMDLDAVWQMACDHKLSALAAYTLQKIGRVDARWSEALAKAIRTHVLFDTERTKILQTMDRNGIWYLPLKGIVLKDYYPQPMLREMSDNDILFDRTKADKVKAIMEDLGYTAVKYGRSVHDQYQKPPLMFEMHTALFSVNRIPLFAEYYKEPESRLIPDGTSRFGYRMTDDDCYIYTLCHMYKHYSQSGTGLRSLLDIYLFLKRKEGVLDRRYIDAELECIGIGSYEKQVRELSQKLFSRAELSDSDRKDLEYYVNSKCYGTMVNRVANSLDGNDSAESKRKYLVRRVFPERTFVNEYYPIVSKHMYLYPFMVVYRIVKGTARKRKQLVSEYKAVKNYQREEKNDSSKRK